MSDVAKTPREELKCEKKYLYEHSMFWECNKGSKCQILEDDVVDLLNELHEENDVLKQQLKTKYVVNKQYEELQRLKKDNKELKKENKQLRKYKERLEKINGGYGHLTHRKGLTANEWLIESQERELKKKNEQISDLKEENERLKQQLFYDGDDVCDICKHEYLIPSGNYFIGKCEKGHEECSTEDIEYCEDFKLKELNDD